MRALLSACLVMATAANLAACASVAAPTAGGPRAHPVAIALASAGRGPRAGNRAEAAALARRMLSRLRLPAGARRLPPLPVPQPLRQPALWAGAAAALDVHQLYKLRQPMDAAAAVLTAHVPAGMYLGGTGALSSPAGVTSREVGYTARSLPAGIYAAQLVLTVGRPGPAGRWCVPTPR